MKELKLKYGCNPNQTPARIFLRDGGDLPLEILNGTPGYINFMDALNALQLVIELKRATGLPAAASFKHVSPAGAAVGKSMSDTLKRACFVDDIKGLDDCPLALAYARARGADRLCSFGDFIALSDVCDVVTARIIAREVSDGVIAPGYSEEALKLLKKKRGGKYIVITIDPDYQPTMIERRDIFGITLEQRRNDVVIDENSLNNIVTTNNTLTEEGRLGLLVALITLKYTQSNSICFARGGQAIGVGAGQQSRVHCTRLAGDKADLWHLRQHEKTLALSFVTSITRPERDNAVDAFLSPYAQEVFSNGGWKGIFTQEPDYLKEDEKKAYLSSISGVALGSDAFFPFDDSIIRAHESGVTFVAQPGGSVRDQEVIDRCNQYGMLMAMTGQRLFHH
ncbi:MAG: phosphoribosylaminoimidazolecarboxamide formyltransferase [Christensenellaceae bacterium]|nr:phosphoribosylaminoimidazolecarboxamide formyltransferase [Christensenellaceae bacterium]